MANTKQAKKMIRKIEKRTQHNRWRSSRVKNAIRDLEEASTKGDSKELSAKLSTLQKEVDKAAKSGGLTKNKASRVKAKASKLVRNSTDTKTETKSKK